MMYTVKMNPVNRFAPRAHRLPMPELFDDPFFRRVMGVEPRRPLGMRVDARETDDAYILEAELPGVALEDISLTAENDVLTIAADINTRSSEERQGYMMTERRSGHVERRFSLKGVRQEDIAAQCLNGVLTVTLPKVKPEGAKALRRIAISAAPAALPEAEEPAEEITIDAEV